MTFDEWKKKQLENGPRKYTHFDPKIQFVSCQGYICNPSKIKQHAFYPLIHFTKESRRIKHGHRADPKLRQIYYASHIDSWIYRYYAYLYNELYNTELKSLGLGDVSVAYRTDLGKSNIDFACSAFSALRDFPSCYVIIGDFTNFFDSLEHRYLKLRLCKLLQVNQLPCDHYAVYKSVTNFHYWELNDLLAYYHLSNNRRDIKQFNAKDRALTPQEFRANRACICKNQTPGVGIPQGTPISAIYANIYMLEADKLINTLVKSLGGIYMRYSDDFMIVLPTDSESEFTKYYATISDIIASIPGLELQGKKTKLFYYSDAHVRNITKDFIPESNVGKNIIDFLGFSFDGCSVKIREKTTFKYYTRMYRKAKTIVRNNGMSPKGKKISCKNLYSKYSYKGSLYFKQRVARKKNLTLSSEERHGNFLDYVARAQDKFAGEPIDCSTRNHMQKIRKRLKPK